MDVFDIEKASHEKLLQYAKEAGFDLKMYKTKETCNDRI